MPHGHILLLFQHAALLTIYSDKYPYKITISYPYSLLYHVHPPLSLSLSLSLFLLNSRISRLPSCNCSPLLNTPISVRFSLIFQSILQCQLKSNLSTYFN
jgi:hypothetical protein